MNIFKKFNKNTVGNPVQATDSAKTKATAKNIYNLIIIDESGSMISIYEPALSGMNETLQTIRLSKKENPEQNHYVSLISFDSNRYNRIYDCVEAEMTSTITEEQYRPGGCTPLYDAMGRAITELRNRVTPDDVVLVTVITDGYENASREYSGKDIMNLVESLKTKGWVFTYIGANQDVEQVASSMAIDNFMAFEADDESTREMFANERKARMKFFDKVKSCRCAAEYSKGYFEDIDE